MASVSIFIHPEKGELRVRSGQNGDEGAKYIELKCKQFDLTIFETKSCSVEGLAADLAGPARDFALEEMVADHEAQCQRCSGALPDSACTASGV